MFPAELFFGDGTVAVEMPVALPKPSMGVFCDGCPACELHGYRDEFIVSPVGFWCGLCGHMTCFKATCRQYVAVPA